MFQSKRYKKVFKKHQLSDFDHIWQHMIDWFEAPNHRRGGWSGVGKLDLGNQNSQEQVDDKKDKKQLSVFVKKQKNHGRRTIYHPFRGEPTFRREFKRLKYLERKNIRAPKVVFYDEKSSESADRAILVTKTLMGYQPLDEVTKQIFESDDVTVEKKRKLLRKVAKAARRFHRAHLVHRAFYPKHIFVKDPTTKPKIAFIDLEKSRFKTSLYYAAYFDLSALLRHSEYWSRADKMYFFLKYFQKSTLTPQLKVISRLIIKRALR